MSRVVASCPVVPGWSGVSPVWVSFSRRRRRERASSVPSRRHRPSRARWYEPTISRLNSSNPRTRVFSRRSFSVLLLGPELLLARQLTSTQGATTAEPGWHGRRRRAGSKCPPSARNGPLCCPSHQLSQASTPFCHIWHGDEANPTLSAYRAAGRHQLACNQAHRWARSACCSSRLEEVLIAT